MRPTRWRHPHKSRCGRRPFALEKRLRRSGIRRRPRPTFSTYPSPPLIVIKSSLKRKAANGADQNRDHIIETNRLIKDSRAKIGVSLPHQENINDVLMNSQSLTGHLADDKFGPARRKARFITNSEIKERP